MTQHKQVTDRNGSETFPFLWGDKTHLSGNWKLIYLKQGKNAGKKVKNHTYIYILIIKSLYLKS